MNKLMILQQLLKLRAVGLKNEVDMNLSLLSTIFWALLYIGVLISLNLLPYKLLWP